LIFKTVLYIKKSNIHYQAIFVYKEPIEPIIDNPLEGEENEIFQQKRITVSRLSFFVRLCRTAGDEPAPV
jgi:translation elongation factor EF-G